MVERWKCTTDKLGLPPAGSEIHTETAHLSKPRLSKPEPSSQCRPDELSSSSQRHELVPRVNRCSQARADYSNQSPHLPQHSRASAEWSQLIDADCARSREAYPRLAFFR